METSHSLNVNNHDHTILGICINDLVGEEVEGSECMYHANSGWESLQVLRLMRVDLILAGYKIPDISLWDLMDRIKVMWPWQRWILVHPELTEQEEREARIRGVLRVMEPCNVSIPDLCRLASKLRAKGELVAISCGARSTYQEA